MTDRISVTGLLVETKIGITEKERSRPQDVVIDLDIVTDLHRAGETDDLEHTIDYDSLVSGIAAMVRASECKLLEKLATKIADEVSAKIGVSGVTVRVMKQHVPVNEEVSGISVYIERGSLG